MKKKNDKTLLECHSAIVSEALETKQVA